MNVLIIGLGKMGTALAKGIKKQGRRVFILGRQGREGEVLKEIAAKHELTVVNQFFPDEIESIMICVKPSFVLPVLESTCKGRLGKNGPLLISIAAGIRIETMELVLGHDVPIARAMPNIASEIARSSTVFATNKHAEVYADKVGILLSAVGEVLQIDESLINVSTAMSGSGIAFFYTAMEAMIDAGVKAGLPRQKARALVVQAAYGASSMAKMSSKHLGELRDDVTTPGGTTIAGLTTLDEYGFRSAIIKASLNVVNRADEIGKEQD